VSAIDFSKLDITDKSVKSIKAKVVNLINLLPKQISTAEFKKKLIAFFIEYFNITSTSQLSEDDVVGINELVKSKYSLWDWNYGYSPTYRFKNKTNNGSISAEISKGIITDIAITCNKLYDSVIEESMKNQRFEHKTIANELHKLKINTNDLEIYKKLFGIIPQPQST
jgi:lipoate-protein ligase A